MSIRKSHSYWSMGEAMHGGVKGTLQKEGVNWPTE